MAKYGKRFALVLCLLALCVGMVSVTAFAVNYDPVTATIPVEVALTGTLPSTPDTFKVQLTADDPSYPMPADAVNGVAVLDFKGSGKDAFKITYDNLGVYTYTAKQLDIGNKDCYQDKGIYDITVYVVNNADYTAFDLTVVVCRQGETEKSDIRYSNRYANPTYAQLAATKTMDKKAPKDGAFQFELLDAAGVAVQTLTNTGSDVVFTPILCNEEGDFTYTIREVDGKNSKIIYDKNAYTAVIHVYKDTNGDYQCEVTYKLGDKVLDTAPAFANKTKPVTPATGDTANLALWGGIMVAALAAIVILLIAMKKKSQKAA